MGIALDSAPARLWRRFWLARGAGGWRRRLCTRLALLGSGAWPDRSGLAALSPRGCIAPSAELIEADLRLGTHVFIGERAILACWKGMVHAIERKGPAREEGFIELGDWVRIGREAVLEVLDGGYICVGRETLIQPCAVLLAAVEPILIGQGAVVGPFCAFFPYDHQFAPGKAMLDQPLDSRGPIVIEDGARLGPGVTVLSGVTIGRDAVVKAGSVVTRNVPAGAVVAGTPARIEEPERGLAGRGRGAL